MSLPQFPSKESLLTRDEAIDSILTSIAMEEVALSHIVNAEGEKIQYAIANMDADQDMQMTLAVNESVSNMLQQVADLQIILKNKLHLVIGLIPKECPKPRPPCPKKCIAEFLAITKRCWNSGVTLPLENVTECESDIGLKLKDCGYYVTIPHGGKHKIKLELGLKNTPLNPVTIEIVLHDINMKKIYSKQLTASEGSSPIHLSGSVIWDVPASRDEHYLSVRLVSENSMAIVYGKVSVIEIF